MSTDTNGKAVIVGAGHAAGVMAVNLREAGWQGSIVMVGEEAHLPYQRPPLSKAFLAGEVEIEQLYLKPVATYERAGVEFIGATRVESIDRTARSVHLADGRALAWDKLVLATGGRVRRLGGANAEAAARMPNFHYLRTIDDVMRIRAQFLHGARLVIVGGGYVGLEVAAIARQRGLLVTVLEAAERVLARVTAPEVSRFYERIHRAEGVDLRTGTQVEQFELDASGDAVAAVVCQDGARIPADLVIVGVGLVPNTELAQAAGLEVDNGIVVDAFTRTSDPDIVAIGDCSNHPNDIYGRRLRLESVPNAMEQARTAAATLCGVLKPYHSVPWFWSDQYDLKLKMTGLSQGYDQFVLRGDTGARSFSAFYLKGGRMIAADTVSRPQDFMLSKRFIAEAIELDPAKLADDSIALKDLLPTSS
ncbi:3-phenylpropionate/trans-cinnamate dioxygenase ferredoxin reductase subunit [Herbaspirillum rubrisubalbicans]|uniref:Pyridine nucleotide-disulfide oxidoreductase n=1 Tax=Herbaspirillum rubrisubalbicans Os34 TaxID=1235827 RepID=A0A6M3ZS70_9BURK|nr:FAD-dependent oxidoreductase [Herbaspirillum rubrisubalbicans]MCP1572894.1 3-phenylpropionate/trans-cinnamate dioxygenase ferredoxin reductase subunit [Herbaspirillum rubrisubalbicans]QJQ01459.1 pyridine nucleotide-disulfide oxidoreductase [Herbaspirillum rubrisubalbicans Os34]